MTQPKKRATGRFWDEIKREYAYTEGAFHQWAAKYDEFESGPGNFTVALIEDVEGNIRECDPHTVRFFT
jgi:hypothetical protein